MNLVPKPEGKEVSKKPQKNKKIFFVQPKVITLDEPDKKSKLKKKLKVNQKWI
jgi:hypothetical protein